MADRLLLLLWLIPIAACSDGTHHNSNQPLPAHPAPVIYNPQESAQKCIPKGPKLMQGSCGKGYVCVPQGLDNQEGICLQDCGHNQAGRLARRDSVCSTKKACMLLKDHELTSLGMFCLTPQANLDQRCEAPFDERACLQGLSCLPTASYEDERGRTIYGLYRCKQECSIEEPCPNQQETCRRGEYGRLEHQPDRQGIKPVQRCRLSACKNDTQCLCDKARGFYCSALMQGLDVGNCVRRLGVCGK